MAVDPKPIADILRGAKQAVEDAAIPAALREVAFEKAVDLLAAKAGLSPSPTVAAAQEQRAAPPSGDQDPKTIAKLAAKLELGVDVVGEVFHVEGDNVALGVGTSKFPSQTRAGARQIALLVAAGRQGGGWDAEWTESSVIRPVAEGYGKFDGNFATTIAGMDEEFSFSGTGAARRLKLKRKGWEEAKALVVALAGG